MKNLLKLLALFLNALPKSDYKPIPLCWLYIKHGLHAPNLVGHASAPSVTTNAATSITTTQFTANGNVTSDGGATITQRGFAWMVGSGTPTTSNNTATVSGTTGTYSTNITGLSPGTLYSVRAYAINSAGTGYGSTVEVTTTANTPPTVALNSPADLATVESTPTLEFTGTDAQSDSIRYNVQVDTGTITNTYYLNASSSGPSDPEGVWTNDDNAFDGSASTTASTTTNEGGSINKLTGYGTNAPSSGGDITQVRFRANNGTSWTSYATLNTPSGGWTWSLLSGLGVEFGKTSIGNFSRILDLGGNSIFPVISHPAESPMLISRAEIEVTSRTVVINKTSNTDSGFANTTTTANTEPFNSGDKISYTLKGLYDNGSSWSDIENIIDGDESTLSTASSNFSSTLFVSGVTITEEAEAFVQVEARVSDGTSWGSWHVLNTPSGDWTWEKIRRLYTNVSTSLVFDTTVRKAAPIYLDGVLLSQSSLLPNVNSENLAVSKIELRVQGITLNSTGYFDGSGSTELADGTYYWRVRGLDPSGTNTYGAWSSTRSFEVAGGTPNYTVTHTTDSLKRTRNTRTHTTNSLKKTRNTRTHTTDSLKKTRNTRTHSADSFLRTRQTRTHTTSSLKRKENTLTHSTDSLKRAQYTRSHTTNALKKRRVTSTHITDAYLTGITTAEISHTSDALKRARYTKTHTIDSLKKTEATKEHSTNSLKLARLTQTHTSDALKKIRNTSTHSSGSLKKTRNTVSHATDSYLASPFSEQERQHVTDALKRTRNTASHTTDSKLAVRFTRTQTVDSLLRKRIEVSHTTSSFTRVRVTRTHSTDSFLRTRNTLTHTTNSLTRWWELDTVSGPNYPFSVANNSSVGTREWTFTENAENDDGTYAIAVELNSSFAGGNVIKDYRARIMKNNVIGSTERAKAGDWSSSPEVSVYGSDSDLWGETWTPADINNGNSGFVISAYGDDFGSPFVISRYLRAGAFGFDIPSDHIINGIEIRVKKRYLSASGGFDVQAQIDSITMTVYHSGPKEVIHTTDSLKLNRNTKTHTTNSLTLSGRSKLLKENGDRLLQEDGDFILLEQEIKTIEHNTDSNLRFEESEKIFHTTDSSKKFNYTKNHTTDLILRNRVATLSYSDSLLRQTDEKTHETSSYTAYRDLLNHSADSLTRKAYEVHSSSDSYLREKQSLEVSHSTDARLYSIGITEVNHDTNSILKDSFMILHETSSVLRKVNEVETQTDSLGKERKEANHTSNSLISSRENIIHSTDSNLNKEESIEHGTDSSKYQVEYILHQTNSIKKTKATTEHQTDSEKRPIISVSHGTDSYIFQDEFPVSSNPGGMYRRFRVVSGDIVGSSNPSGMYRRSREFEGQFTESPNDTGSWN